MEAIFKVKLTHAEFDGEMKSFIQIQVDKPTNVNEEYPRDVQCKIFNSEDYEKALEFFTGSLVEIMEEQEITEEPILF